ncbi:MAG: DNA repair protein RadA [Eubacteriales bacterium]
MAKQKTEFVCSECGFKSSRWLGKCQNCGSWNTMVEEIVEEKTERTQKKSMGAPSVLRLDEIPMQKEKRIPTQIGEFDRVLGGGVVPGSVVLAGGEPGIGKSTLFLQIAKELMRSGSVLYVSGEESPAQVKMRAERLGMDAKMLFMAETDINTILEGIEQSAPKFVIIDSIQTMYDPDLSSAPGSVSQVRQCAGKIVSEAKKRSVAVFIIGHVTKEGAIAGPRVLEHLVDTVLYFEGEYTSNLRILRAVKNRFGSTDEVGIFEMRDIGMQEVKNPSLINEGDQALSGVSVFCAAQGTRPMLLEIQALVASTQLALPRRLASGMDAARLYMISAVLEKKIGLKLYNQDIFINVAGGIRIKEYASDLALAASIVSSLRNLPLLRGTAVIGEVGLAGEVRHVSWLPRRIAECAKMGFKRVIVPSMGLEKGLPQNITVIGVHTLSDALTKLF